MEMAQGQGGGTQGRGWRLEGVGGAPKGEGEGLGAARVWGGAWCLPPFGRPLGAAWAKAQAQDAPKIAANPLVVW